LPVILVVVLFGTEVPLLTGNAIALLDPGTEVD